MTNQTRSFDQAEEGRRIVYVRQVRPEEIPHEAAATIEGALYAIHDQSGNRIGLAPGRDLAFMAARQHELTPVSVH